MQKFKDRHGHPNLPAPVQRLLDGHDRYLPQALFKLHKAGMRKSALRDFLTCREMPHVNQRAFKMNNAQYHRYLTMINRYPGQDDDDK